MNDLITILNESTKVYSVRSKDINSDTPFYDMIVIVKNERSYIEFFAMEPTTIGKIPNQPRSLMQVQFICSGSIKFDLCSHMYFTGEDCIIEEENDSYYHICGDYSYTQMILLPCTLIEIAKKEFGESFNCKDAVNDTMKSFLEVYNKDYIIEEFDYKKYDIEPFVN